jgi:organic radical activating enzyme
MCGGEPTLQLDSELIAEFKRNGWYISIETNGLRKVPDGIDYIVCSPKTSTIAPDNIDELRYVTKVGDAIPTPCKKAKHYFLSPCFDGEKVVPENVQYCLKLVAENPKWRFGAQWHKFIGVE